MATIETLDGPLDTAELGTVLMHEHVFNITAEIQIAHPGFNGWDAEVEVPKAQEKLRAVKEAGIDTLVELSPIGLGRSLELIRGACEGSGEPRIIGDESVDPARVMLAHCGDTTDLAYLEEMAASGALLGMDRFGLDVLLPYEDRVNTVVAMCERGHADKMILSQDAACFSDWFPPGLKEEIAPNWHHLHVVQDVVP